MEFYVACDANLDLGTIASANGLAFLYEYDEYDEVCLCWCTLDRSVRLDSFTFDAPAAPATRFKFPTTEAHCLGDEAQKRGPDAAVVPLLDIRLPSQHSPRPPSGTPL